MLYFDHDTTSWQDDKIMCLRASHGGEAVDAFWYLIERMGFTEEPICLSAMGATRAHAHNLCITEEKFKTYVTAMLQVGLLEEYTDSSGNTCVASSRIMATVDRYHDKSNKARAAVSKRWAKKREQEALLLSAGNTDEIQMDNGGNSNVIPPNNESNTDVLPTNNMRNTNEVQTQYAPNTKRREEKRREDTKDILSGAPDDGVKISSDSTTSQAQEVILYLNAKACKDFMTNRETSLKPVRARLAEGFSVEDCKRVIDIKAAQWLHDRKMNRYLRPATLFAKEKFESYLNEQPKGGESYAVVSSEYADAF